MGGRGEERDRKGDAGEKATIDVPAPTVDAPAASASRCCPETADPDPAVRDRFSFVSRTHSQKASDISKSVT